jgi:hypothetical protein
MRSASGVSPQIGVRHPLSANDERAACQGTSPPSSESAGRAVDQLGHRQIGSKFELAVEPGLCAVPDRSMARMRSPKSRQRVRRIGPVVGDLFCSHLRQRRTEIAH